MPIYNIEQCNYIATEDAEFEYVNRIELFEEHGTSFVGFYDDNNDYYIYKLSSITYFAKIKEES